MIEKLNENIKPIFEGNRTYFSYFYITEQLSKYL